MSMFDDNIDGSPVTAQMLRNMLAERSVKKEDSKIIRYEKILNHIFKLVRYNMDEQIWEYKTSLAVIGATTPFTSDYIDQINTQIEKNKKVADIYEWIKDHPMQLSKDLDDFVKYFDKRGFKIRFDTCKYLKSENRKTDKVIIISWK